MDMNGEVMARRVWGKEGIRERYRDQFAQFPGATIEILTNSATFACPDVIVADGSACLVGPKADQMTPARWVRILHRGEDGDWRIAFLQVIFPEQ